MHNSLISVPLCRYLAIVAALASEADFIFCPESPPPKDWPEKLCNKLALARIFFQFYFACKTLGLF